MKGFLKMFKKKSRNHSPYVIFVRKIFRSFKNFLNILKEKQHNFRQKIIILTNSNKFQIKINKFNLITYTNVKQNIMKRPIFILQKKEAILSSRTFF